MNTDSDTNGYEINGIIYKSPTNIHNINTINNCIRELSNTIKYWKSLKKSKRLSEDSNLDKLVHLYELYIDQKKEIIKNNNEIAKKKKEEERLMREQLKSQRLIEEQQLFLRRQELETIIFEHTTKIEIKQQKIDEQIAKLRKKYEMDDMEEKLEDLKDELKQLERNIKEGKCSICKHRSEEYKGRKWLEFDDSETSGSYEIWTCRDCGFERKELHEVFVG